MSGVGSTGEAPVARGGQERVEPTAKVVLIELANASRPISTSGLAQRTLLSESTIEATLHVLTDAGLCSVVQGDESPPCYTTSQEA